ncbi:hypothetical protein [Planctomicrobium sp. SH527]|uniref:hypothetical protein n=1 Tax=Planctomicrobium sp. SH527 TaxID=3448123 RepID=UPI003F5CA5FD
MQRRDFLCSLAAAPALLNIAADKLEAQTTSQPELLNPYEEVNWGNWEYLHSMSHQHQGETDASRDTFYKMGYRHFAFSNYYPSSPVEMSETFQKSHPDVVSAPNAEQHSFTDAGLHFNGIGSRLSTGYGSTVGNKQLQECPFKHEFNNLNVFGAKPYLGTYRLDVTIEKQGDKESASPALLTVRGATKCSPRQQFEDQGPVENLPLNVGAHSMYFRMSAPDLKVEVAYDNSQLKITRVRLMQGTNRPWREMFKAALDGEVIDGQQVGGLLHPTGGGVTLNHPTLAAADYFAMLDFDPRVLGIEIWNQHHGFGFGSKQRKDEYVHYYRLWDQILSTGRRCWAFCVKDHLTFGRGRNVLIVPPAKETTPEEREALALKAYRQGAFFGSVASLSVNDYGEVAAPYDYSEFRFSRIEVLKDESGKAKSLVVEVTGNDKNKKPNVQIRIVTDRGIEMSSDDTTAEFPFERDTTGRIKPSFVRVEAFCYPNHHFREMPLTARFMRSLDVHGIAQLNGDQPVEPTKILGSEKGPAPIVDMIFSQPLMRV